MLKTCPRWCKLETFQTMCIAPSKPVPPAKE
jgi:hypothetical protein